MSRQALRLFTLALAFFGLMTAQLVTGSISGSAIARARLVLTSESTGAARQGVTDGDGNFVFSAILPGAYTPEIAPAGFNGGQRGHIGSTGLLGS